MNTITTNNKARQIVNAYEALPEEMQKKIYPLFEALAEGRATKQDLLAALENMMS